MGLHIFDLDGTLVRKNTSFHFYFFLLRRKILPVSTLLPVMALYCRYQAGLPVHQLHREVFEKVFLGRSLKALESAVAPFLDEFLSSHVRLKLLSKAKGKMRWLFSNSPEFLVRGVAERLGLDYWKGTEYVTDAKGNITDIACLVDGAQKLIFAQESPFQREEIIAYSDSVEDLPLLEWVGKAEVVHPDRRLLRFAKRRGWEIVEDIE